MAQPHPRPAPLATPALAASLERLGDALLDAALAEAALRSERKGA